MIIESAVQIVPFFLWQLVFIYICKPKIYELISSFGTTV